VTLAAARVVGDVALADALDREAELLGLPWPGAGGRRYAFGLLPVGDAFLAWARSHPTAEGPTVSEGPGGPRWPAMIVLVLLPGLVTAGLWRLLTWRQEL